MDFEDLNEKKKEKASADCYTLLGMTRTQQHLD